MNKDEALNLALEALERVDAIERGMVTTSRHHYQAKEDTTKAITALREALAAQRTWVGLDHQDKKKFSSWLDHKTDDEVFTAIDDLLREMNT